MSGSERFALDSGVLLFNYCAGRPERTTGLVRNSLLNLVTLSETLYVICRIDGVEKAQRFIEECAKETVVVPSERVAPLAGHLKCRYPISLADCWALATAKAFDVPCLFAFRESEIVRNLDLIRREVQVKFLDELQGT
ncbi:PIN domain-containing protein [[Eubacterium] cellulosolvens]